MKLLFIAYPFPPSRAVGAVRTWNLARHLSALGFEITVLTPDPRLLTDPDPSIDIEAECKRAGVNRVLTGHGLRFLMGGWLSPRYWERSRVSNRALRRAADLVGVSPTIGWFAPVLATAEGLGAGRFDLILATGPPFESFVLGWWLSQRLRAPYVLDYRDPWTLAHHGAASAPESLRKLEGHLVRRAAGVQLISRVMVQDFEREFPAAPEPAFIPNGFDSAEMSEVEPMRFDHTALVYAGTFYPEKRSIAPVLNALALANARRGDTRQPIYLHYFGSQEAHVREKARDTGATPWVVLHGTVPRREALAAMKGASAVVVITSVLARSDARDRGIMTGKIFEAIGLGAPVMLVAPPDSEPAQVVERAGGGAHFVGSDVEGMADWMVTLGGHRGGFEGTALQEYAWDHIAIREADVLRRAARSRGLAAAYG